MRKTFPKHIKKKKSSGSDEISIKDGKYSLNGRSWISKGNETFLGYGRVVLLERIMKYGSITKAAKSMAMSYRNAWELVDSMNKQANKPLVDLYTGGKGGGGAVVTKYGEKSIALFWKIQNDFNDFFKEKKKELSVLYDQ